MMAIEELSKTDLAGVLTEEETARAKQLAQELAPSLTEFFDILIRGYQRKQETTAQSLALFVGLREGYVNLSHSLAAETAWHDMPAVEG